MAADMESAHRCVSIEEAAARLACFDAAFGRGTSAGQTAPARPVTEAPAGSPVATGSTAGAPSSAAPGSSGTATSAAAATTATAAATSTDAVRAVEEFGLTESAKRARDPEKAKETMPQSISASVTQVDWRPTGEVVVTLGNGQVWEQSETVTTRARVKVGDAVTIRKAALGSYTMLTPTKAVVRVRRVR
jgi:hypothetical protein